MGVMVYPRQFAAGVYQLCGGEPHPSYANVYLLTGRWPTLIDCGQPEDVPRILAGLRKLGLKLTDIKQVIATHADYDHISAFPLLRAMHPRLQLRMHALAWEDAKHGDAYRNAAYVYGKAFEPLPRQHRKLLRHGQRIRAGDHLWQVLETPGHTPGCICLLGASMRLIFAGDTFCGGMRSLTGADLGVWCRALLTWQASLRMLQTHQFDWVLNGHGGAEELPISRSRFDQLVEAFGTMLNPWFEPYQTEAIQPEAAEQSAAQLHLANSLYFSRNLANLGLIIT